MSRIIVTGGNRGIGKQICKELSQQGHEVILTTRNEEKGKEAAEEIGSTFMQLDMSDSSSVPRLQQHFQKNSIH